MKSRCFKVWGANWLFLVWMNFKDGRFQQCRNGVLGAGARCCSSRAIGEARDPTGHSMWTIQIFQIFQKLLGVKVIFHIFHLWGRRCGFKASTGFWVFRSAWTLLDWIADWAVDLCQSWSSLTSYVLMFYMYKGTWDEIQMLQGLRCQLVVFGLDEFQRW